MQIDLSASCSGATEERCLVRQEGRIGAVRYAYAISNSSPALVPSGSLWFSSCNSRLIVSSRSDRLATAFSN